MEAIKARRTYAVNADRVGLEFKLNGKWMGKTLAPARTREVRVKVKGEDVIDRVEVLKNNRVIHRNHPVDGKPGISSWGKPVLCRIEYGWDRGRRSTCEDVRLEIPRLRQRREDPLGVASFPVAPV